MSNQPYQKARLKLREVLKEPVEVIKDRIQRGQVEDDIFWAYNAIPLVKVKDNGEYDKRSLEAMKALAPTGGALLMLEFGLRNRGAFLKDLFSKAVAQKKKEEGRFKDDGRADLEIFTEARNYFAEKY